MNEIIYKVVPWAHEGHTLAIHFCQTSPKNLISMLALISVADLSLYSAVTIFDCRTWNAELHINLGYELADCLSYLSIILYMCKLIVLCLLAYSEDNFKKVFFRIQRTKE